MLSQALCARLSPGSKNRQPRHPTMPRLSLLANKNVVFARVAPDQKHLLPQSHSIPGGEAGNVHSQSDGVPCGVRPIPHKDIPACLQSSGLERLYSLAKDVIRSLSSTLALMGSVTGITIRRIGAGFPG